MFNEKNLPQHIGANTPVSNGTRRFNQWHAQEAQMQNQTNGGVVFQVIIAEYILPLVHGASLEGPCAGRKNGHEIVSFDTQHRLHIALPDNEVAYLILKRAIPFTQEEKEFINRIVTRMFFENVHKRTSYHFIMCEAIEHALAIRIAGKYAATLCQVIQVYTQWSSETYAGQRIEHTTGICLNRQQPGNMGLYSLKNTSIVKTLGATNDTMLLLDRDGVIFGVESISTMLGSYKKNLNTLSPVLLNDIALWTGTGSKIAVRLTTRGEILIFADKCLVFAKRRALWRCFPHKSFLEAILSEEESNEDKKLKKAVYLTVLDLAFAHQGACIGILSKGCNHPIALQYLKEDELLSASVHIGNGEVLKNILGSQNFYELPRKIRMSLCSIDGALIMDNTGTILTAGARVQTNGSFLEGGGRTTTAQALAADGIGINVSCGGYVEIFTRQRPPLQFA